VDEGLCSLYFPVGELEQVECQNEEEWGGSIKRGEHFCDRVIAIDFGGE